MKQIPLFVCFLVALFVACSSGRTQADCDKIATEIRDAATARGIPTQGACANPAPAAQDLKPRCDDLKKCQDEVD